jgi:flagella basal body P-ring formation protein FlgA
MFFLVCILLSFFSMGSGAPAVHLKENIYFANEQEILLSDIATFVDIDQASQISLQKEIISSSVKEYQNLPRHQLLKKLKDLLSEYEKKCECRVQIIINQSKEAVAFSPEEAQRRLQEKLQTGCSKCIYQLGEFKILNGQIPENYKTWMIQEGVGEIKGQARLQIYFDDQVMSPLVLQGVVRVQQPILVLKKSVQKGSVLSDLDFELQIKETTHENKNFATIEDLIGKELKRTLVRGQWVAVDDLSDRQSVRLGQPVAIEIKNGAISLEMAGTAQKNGKLGDRIPVRVNKTQKQIMGEVIGESRVRL